MSDYDYYIIEIHMCARKRDVARRVGEKRGRWFRWTRATTQHILVSLHMRHNDAPKPEPTPTLLP